MILWLNYGRCIYKGELVWNDERAKEMRFRECIMPKISRVAFSILWIKAAMLMSTKLTRVAKAADAFWYWIVAVVQQKWCCKCCCAILSLFKSAAGDDEFDTLNQPHSQSRCFLDPGHPLCQSLFFSIIYLTWIQGASAPWQELWQQKQRVSSKYEDCWLCIGAKSHSQIIDYFVSYPNSFLQSWMRLRPFSVLLQGMQMAMPSCQSCWYQSTSAPTTLHSQHASPSLTPDT